MKPKFQVDNIIRYMSNWGIEQDVRCKILKIDIETKTYLLLYTGRYRNGKMTSIPYRNLDCDHELCKESIWNNEIKDIINE